MQLIRSSLSCLLFIALVQTLAVRCENATQPTTNPDEMTSSVSAVTSSQTLATSEEVKVSTTEAVMKSSGINSSASADVTTSSANAAVEHSTSESESPYPTHPGDHGDTHPTHPPHPKDASHSNTTGHGEEGAKSTMGIPPEGDDEGGDGGAEWVVSIIVVFALMGGMIAFVIVFVFKDRARRREKNLSDMKRPGIGGDHGFMPLKEIKTEGEPAKLTKVEKKQSERGSYYGNPEDAVPLLELHIAGDGHSVLNANDETQAEPNGNTATRKPFLDVYADGSKKSQEKLNSPRFI